MTFVTPTTWDCAKCNQRLLTSSVVACELMTTRTMSTGVVPATISVAFRVIRVPPLHNVIQVLRHTTNRPSELHIITINLLHYSQQLHFSFTAETVTYLLTYFTYFLADRTDGRAYATVFRLSSVVVVCTGCIVAKRCIQKLLLTAYVVCKKSTGTKLNDLDLCLMFRGRLKSCQPIASHSPLNISETVRDTSLVPKNHQ